MGHSVARYICSLALLATLTYIAALYFVTLAHSVHGLAQSLSSLRRRTAEIYEYVFTL